MFLEQKNNHNPPLQSIIYLKTEAMAPQQRRLPVEVTFIGKPLNLDNGQEPPLRRGRSKREEQVHIQQQ